MKMISGLLQVIVLVSLVGISPLLGATEGRVAGTVVDPDGNPLADVQITVVARNYDFETQRTTNKKGRFNLLVMDATREYGIILEKDGYQTIQEPIDPPLGDTLRHTWTMVPGSGGAPAVATPSAGERIQTFQGRSAWRKSSAAGEKRVSSMECAM